MDAIETTVVIVEQIEGIRVAASCAKWNKSKCAVIAKSVQSLSSLLKSNLIDAPSEETTRWRFHSSLIYRLRTLHVNLQGVLSKIQGSGCELTTRQDSVQCSSVFMAFYNIDEKFRQFASDIEEAHVGLAKLFSLYRGPSKAEQSNWKFELNNASEKDLADDLDSIQTLINHAGADESDLREVLENYKLLLEDQAAKNTLKLMSLEQSESDKLEASGFHLLPSCFIEPEHIAYDNDPSKKSPAPILLGKGGFGIVYRGKLRNTLRVAIKVVEATGTDTLGELQNELDIMANLAHDNVIVILGGFYPVKPSHQSDSPFLVMELAENNSLSRQLGLQGTKERSLPIVTKLSIMAGIANGLCYLHAHGVAHRDIKPDNVLLTAENEPKLTDFGLSKLKGTESVMQSRLGTPLYLAPELLGSEVCYTDAIDIWAFGVIMFEMIIERRMWHGLAAAQITHRVLHNDLPWDLLTEKADEWPTEYVVLLKKCLQFDYAVRPKATDLSATLEKILAEYRRQQILMQTSRALSLAVDVQALDSSGLTAATDSNGSGRRAKPGTDKELAVSLASLGLEDRDSAGSHGNNQRNSSSRELHELQQQVLTRKISGTDFPVPRNDSTIATAGQDAFAFGKEWEKLGNFEYALVYYENAAVAGNAEAQLRLGQIFEGGAFGQAIDLNKAVAWTSVAAQQGFPEAQFVMGRYCRQGIVVQKSMSKALSWYRSAAANGYVQAYNSMGACFEDEDNPLCNPSDAFTCYVTAAELGCADGAYNAGVCCAQGKGTIKDEAQAVIYYRQAAEKEKPRACFNLGCCYQAGQGVPKNLEAAVYWFQRGAALNHKKSMYYLGTACYAGHGVPKSNAKAYEWFLQAAESGLPEAQLALGSCYYSGQGIPQNFAEAGKWYAKSAEQMNFDAATFLAAMYMSGTGVPKDPEAGIRLYALAAQKGKHAGAQYSLGMIYKNGTPPAKRNLELAKKWMTVSAAQGYSKSIQEMSRWDATVLADASARRTSGGSGGARTGAGASRGTTASAARTSDGSRSDSGGSSKGGNGSTRKSLKK